MSGRRSKRKGAEGERELAREISRLFGVEACRGRQYHGGSDSPDVRAAIPGVHWESKRAERFNAYDALQQAQSDAGESVPVVAHRRNSRPWIVCLYLDDLPRLAVPLYLTLSENA